MTNLVVKELDLSESQFNDSLGEEDGVSLIATVGCSGVLEITREDTMETVAAYAPGEWLQFYHKEEDDA